MANHLTAGLFALTIVVLLSSPSAGAGWSAQPGETVRNAFGPTRGDNPPMCRGACGMGCPDTCSETVAYECVDATHLRRVKAYQCGTHAGCRTHDDCLDTCSQSGGDDATCEPICHKEAVESFGLEPATSWATGGGPFDGPPIRFEYTRDGSAPEPAFRCPDKSRLDCAGAAGRCLSDSGSTVDPVFDTYPSMGPAAMRISGFRSGPLCAGQVCEQSADIQMTGKDSCDRSGVAKSCTRYGMEFGYQNADPSMPLECTATTIGGDRDFIGDLIVKGLGAMPQQQDNSAQAAQTEGDGMKQLLGMFQQVVASANSPEDVQVSMAPLGADGKPIESQRVGSPPNAGPPQVPRTVALPASSGHLVVPMYQLADTAGTKPFVREIRCSHKGVRVLETSFRMGF